MSECLSENVVLELVEGRLDATALASVGRHIPLSLLLLTLGQVRRGRDRRPRRQVP